MVLPGLLVLEVCTDFEVVVDCWGICDKDVDTAGDFVEYALTGILPTRMKVELKGDFDGDSVVHSP